MSQSRHDHFPRLSRSETRYWHSETETRNWHSETETLKNVSRDIQLCYERYVQAKLSHTPFVADIIYVNDIEKKQHHAAASKSLNEIKRLIFGILEELPQTKRQTLKELYNKEIDSQRSELHEYLDFYMMLLQLKRK